MSDKPAWIDDNGHFKCPRCGGPYFGTVFRRSPNGELLPERVHCHSLADGKHHSQWHQPGTPYCGWSAKIES